MSRGPSEKISVSTKPVAQILTVSVRPFKLSWRSRRTVLAIIVSGGPVDFCVVCRLLARAFRAPLPAAVISRSAGRLPGVETRDLVMETAYTNGPTVLERAAESCSGKPVGSGKLRPTSKCTAVEIALESS